MNMTNAQASQIMERAAELVERGWCQHRSAVISDDGRQVEAVCLGYAIGTAQVEILGRHRGITSGSGSDQVWFAAQRRIRDITDGKYSYIPGWNDANGRTKQQVVDLALEISKEFRILADAEGVA